MDIERDEGLNACLFAEAKMLEARQLLLDAGPGAIEPCQNELQQIVATLEKLVSDRTLEANSSASSALLRIRRSAQALKLQIEYSSRLYCGWVQLRLGAGYTQQGLPVFATSEPGSCSFEG